MKRILITGITGELGSALARRIKTSRIPATCLIRNSTKKTLTGLDGCEILNVDITNREDIFKNSAALRGKIDTIVHLASARAGFPKKEIHDTIYNGSVNLYDLAEDIKCRKYLFFSSILAAGWAPHGIGCIDEKFTPSKERLSYFGKIKLETEKKLLELSKDGFTKIIILRPGNIYGPPKMSFISFIVEILKKRKKIFYQRAKNSVMWTPIYIQDVIDCVFRLLEEDAFNNETYFLTGSEIATVERLSSIVSNAIGIRLENLEIPSCEKWRLSLRIALDSLRGFVGRPSFPNFIYSSKKITDDFGFIPKVNLTDGIPLTIEWASKRGLI